MEYNILIPPEEYSDQIQQQIQQIIRPLTLADLADEYYYQRRYYQSRKRKSTKNKKNKKK